MTCERIATSLAVGLITLTFFVGAPRVAAGDAEVLLTEELRFEPDEIWVLPNTMVRWRNAGSSAWHTVTADEDAMPAGAPYFDSSGGSNETSGRHAPPDRFLRPGQTFNVTFATLGDYRYFCVPHEGAGMVGVVHVVAKLPDESAGNPPLALIAGLGIATLAVAVGILVHVRRRRTYRTGSWRQL